MAWRPADRDAVGRGTLHMRALALANAFSVRGCGRRTVLVKCPDRALSQRSA